jgi:hypothetical protein
MGEKMAEPETTEEQQQTIERGTYEIIRDRLIEQGRELANRAQALNKKRLDLFGGTEMTVVGNERIRTDNNCIPQDIVEVGDNLLFGYNVYMGLKRETAIDDVLALHTFEEDDNGGFSFEHTTGDFLADEKFVEQFDELYKFYKETRLQQLRRVPGKLLAVFQVGHSAHDIRVFQWAVYPGGNTRYIDNRGEREHIYPASHDFEWIATSREDHVAGRHPHVNVLDEVFVETVGGDLTIKVEDSTEDGLGIYREPVEDPDQSLDDAEIHYAKVGVLILLKVLPYREQTWRYLVFNTRTYSVTRIDAIGLACVQLPEDHGIIFPGGYYLQGGDTKSFEAAVANLEFMHMVRSPNGEDVLYIFHNRDTGSTLLLPYNLIRKEIQNPIRCNGYSIFDNGRMIVFKTVGDEPTRVHPMQIWQTPFVSDEFAAKAPSTGSYLEKVGNADLVRGISDAFSLRRMIEEQQPSLRIYEDLIASATRMIDTFYWLDHDEVGDLHSAVKEVRTTAELIIDEFEKVDVIRQQAVKAVEQAETQVVEVIRGITPRAWRTVEPFVEALSDLRKRRGHVITLRDMRYADLEALDALEAKVVEEFDKLSALTVDFLTGDEALAPYRDQIAGLEGQIDAVEKVAEAVPLQEQLETLDFGLELLTEVVTGLEIEDATVRTQILESISGVLGSLNRTRALLESHRRELMSTEAVAEFGAQFKVFTQSVTSGLSMADTPERCDAELSKLMLGLEDMESRFSDFDEFLDQLSTKREEVYEAFSSKKQLLLDQRQRRADHLMQAAERILDSISRRAMTFSDVDELNSYFASDTMVAKVRDLSDKLRKLGDSVKADEAEARLKSTRQEAARAQKDRQDIYEEGAEVIKLGRHRFSVNTQPLDLTMVPRDGVMYLHLSGTDFYEKIDDPEFAETAPFWDQQMVSETPQVYRCEYLAACILADAEEETDGLSVPKLRKAAIEEEGLLEIARSYTSSRYDEGYERGLHDADTALILDKLLGIYATADLLRYAPAPRAYACLFWAYYLDEMARSVWQRRARSLVRLRNAFAHSQAIAAFTDELTKAMASFYQENAIEVFDDDLRIAANYLFEELGKDPISFVTSAEAVALRKAFVKHLKETGDHRAFEEDLHELQYDLTNRYNLGLAWMSAFLEQSDDDEVTSNRHAREEAVVLLLTEAAFTRSVSHAMTAAEVDGLLGQHPLIQKRKLPLRLDEFLARLGSFRHHQVPGFRAFQEARHNLLERERHRLRLDEFMPKVMSAFVRNQLINDVYLPLIGDNLAKQMGALGEGKRTDLMGMLLLISPPGYGKTTLMEYIANRLGLIFMKINGPALGHSVTSLDPAEAPNATARQEVEKINLAFEMGNNVMLYVDDIQHTHSELLQKFISLCDAQRRVEGVWKGRTRTYDMRGKRFCVCMAGNPYTESGERFQIPDMLANRADTYNLGDILEGKENAFALSYIENSLTSNPVLSPLTTRAQEDLYLLVKMAKDEPVQTDQLSHPYSSVELGELLEVLKKLLRVQQVLLAVNQQYIYSASQDEAFRTEPRFQLQGSYRNMNKLAEKIVPVMNEAELEALIDDHYLGEAQTLTTGAENNLLKLGELRGVMTEEQQKRWDEIKRSYGRLKAMGGEEDDPVARVTGTLGHMSDQLGDIGAQIVAAGTALSASQQKDLGEQLVPFVEKLHLTMTEMAASRKVEGELLPAPELIDPETVKQITDNIGMLSQGLEAIGKAIVTSAKAAKKVPPPPPQDMTPFLEGIEKAMASMAKQKPAAGVAESLGPYLEGLNQTMVALGQASGMKVVQSLGPGVHDLLDEMAQTAETGLMDTLRAIDRRIKSAGLPPDKNLGALINKTLKNFDMMKDLMKSLKKIDTEGLGNSKQ